VRQPPVADIRAVLDVVRRAGSVHYRKSEMPGDFLAWRRRVRQQARAEELSISVIRTADFVVVENRDWQPSGDDDLAVADVIEGVLTGNPIQFDEALQRRRRQRLRTVADHEVDRS
jgi:hypothetical protein